MTKAGAQRTIGLVGATTVGVGAIVGGGILVLGGVALAATGPSAVLAFALNGFIAVLTALSFAEMSSAFPQSGGAYLFAKKVLNVQAAFAAGWILWFAYIVAAVLYALGFAEYGIAMLAELWIVTTGTAPAWLSERAPVMILAAGSTLLYAAALMRRATGGGEWATYGKVVVFAVIIVAGLWALGADPGRLLRRGLSPFFSSGSLGFIQAMGLSFIALQGFDLIATIGGEVKQPRRTIPRAMLLSLAIGLAVYLPLLVIVATVGAPAGSTVVELSRDNPATVMAVAVGHFMGPTGYWLVAVAAVLSTLTALQANLLAASRVAQAMGRDRTLPRVLGELHPSRHTPHMALATSALAVLAIMAMVPSVAQAGAAASLIFLVSFALAHLTSYLARRRTGGDEGAYHTPWFPLVPVVGGVMCAGLALFQAVAEPSAGAIAALWLGLGAVLYMALFRSRAQAVDAFAEARDPGLARLRGRSPLVLVPIANPDNAAALVDMAQALAPQHVGRVLLLSVMTRNSDESASDSIRAAQQTLQAALTESLAAGQTPEALMTVATGSGPWDEIRRVAQAHRCESLLVGMSSLGDDLLTTELEALLNDVDAHAAIMKVPSAFKLASARRILVPVGGMGGQDAIRARLLGSLERTHERQVSFVTVTPALADSERKRLGKQLQALADEETLGEPHVELIEGDDPAALIVARAADADLVVLGMQRSGDRKAFGALALRIVRDSPCATVLLSRR